MDVTQKGALVGSAGLEMASTTALSIATSLLGAGSIVFSCYHLHAINQKLVKIEDILCRMETHQELKEEAKKCISEKGYDSQFGARPLHRAIHKYLEDPLAEEILNMNVKNGDVLVASLDKENSKITFDVKDNNLKKEKASEV